MPRRIAGPCPVTGCPNRAGQCEQHRKQAARAHRARYASNYGPQHEALRADYQHRMAAGETFNCWRCGAPIDPRSWDLGHNDDGHGHRGPECVPCNRATAGRRGGG